MLHTDSIAAFGQLQYRLVGGLKAIAGLRVQNESGYNYGYQYTPIQAGDAPQPGHWPCHFGCWLPHSVQL